jgi:hypothetical protein
MVNEIRSRAISPSTLAWCPAESELIMSRSSLQRDPAPPLPERIEEWERQIKAERTLNDLVEDIHRVLVNEDKDYRAYLRAVYDAHAVEGSLAADNILAAMIIRDKAKELGSTEVAGEKLAIINLALNVVLRRYNKSRKQRRNTVHGELVRTNHGELGHTNDDE